MPFTDKPLKCKDCNEDFIFTGKQQEHHAKLGLRNEPKRFMICRQVALRDPPPIKRTVSYRIPRASATVIASRMA